jgi:hypothetical protein
MKKTLVLFLSLVISLNTSFANQFEIPLEISNPRELGNPPQNSCQPLDFSIGDNNYKSCFESLDSKSLRALENIEADHRKMLTQKGIVNSDDLKKIIISNLPDDKKPLIKELIQISDATEIKNRIEELNYRYLHHLLPPQENPEILNEELEALAQDYNRIMEENELPNRISPDLLRIQFQGNLEIETDGQKELDQKRMSKIDAYRILRADRNKQHLSFDEKGIPKFSASMIETAKSDPMLRDAIAKFYPHEINQLLGNESEDGASEQYVGDLSRKFVDRKVTKIGNLVVSNGAQIIKNRGTMDSLKTIGDVTDYNKNLAEIDQEIRDKMEQFLRKSNALNARTTGLKQVGKGVLRNIHYVESLFIEKFTGSLEDDRRLMEQWANSSKEYEEYRAAHDELTAAVMKLHKLGISSEDAKKINNRTTQLVLKSNDDMQAAMNQLKWDVGGIIAGIALVGIGGAAATGAKATQVTAAASASWLSRLWSIGSKVAIGAPITKTVITSAIIAKDDAHPWKSFLCNILKQGPETINQTVTAAASVRAINGLKGAFSVKFPKQYEWLLSNKKIEKLTIGLGAGVTVLKLSEKTSQTAKQISEANSYNELSKKSEGLPGGNQANKARAEELTTEATSSVLGLTSTIISIHKSITTSMSEGGQYSEAIKKYLGKQGSGAIQDATVSGTIDSVVKKESEAPPTDIVELTNPNESEEKVIAPILDEP